MSKATRDYEIVLWGATGFTGALVARHLADNYGDDLDWALAGRNMNKLRALRDSLGMPDLPVIQADSADRESLGAMSASTRVICTTVGPYALYGDELLAACAATGTHYCDLTGEVQWMARTIARYLAPARDSGARIVHTCGFDSIPTDLGTWYLQEQMFERYGEYADVVKSRVGDFSGGASGGTIASMLQMLEEAGNDPAVREALANPYSLNPDGEQWGPDEVDSNLPQYDRDLGQWTAPFVMAAINTRVVRRSNALAGYPWGVDFRVDERLLTGHGLIGKARAAAIGIGSGLTPLAMGLKPLRRMAGRVLPAPGEGPSPEEQRRGHFELFLHGRNLASDKALTVRVRGDRDPGYGATSRMLGEAAVCLARDELDCPGGLWTPATAMAGLLVERLQAKAGVSFEVVDG
ncbi:saccharopine dehydrogenase [Seongchinamella sediminis]|uniref:Saccharopine dehydrogenase n=1 Tax=Seongchinamella sediminis TaxID=2283635 RepID=A0A3L7E145_9GAMM|nr:saccharopine dehydrogenase NADP-binding domain-containing protein [Seongchinamella sediminis]RLQ22450.1 saccharopine dehydrogenase [Seongchinamella sediminis]